jgi:ABC-type lipoprotein release transport system permease subunit
MFNYNIHEKEVISNIIGLNPTGTLSFNGTFAMNGSNNNVNTQENISRANLKKTEANEFINNSNVIENFESYHKKYKYKNNNLFDNNDYIYIILILILFLMFIIICNKK